MRIAQRPQLIWPLACLSALLLLSTACEKHADGEGGPLAQMPPTLDWLGEELEGKAQLPACGTFDKWASSEQEAPRYWRCRSIDAGEGYHGGDIQLELTTDNEGKVQFVSLGGQQGSDPQTLDTLRKKIKAQETKHDLFAIAPGKNKNGEPERQICQGTRCIVLTASDQRWEILWTAHLPLTEAIRRQLHEQTQGEVKAKQGPELTPFGPNSSAPPKGKTTATNAETP